MFVLTKPRVQQSSSNIIRIPVTDIFRADIRDTYTEPERVEDAQTEQRTGFRYTQAAAILPSYDADMVHDIDRNPVPVLVCPANMTGYTAGDWVVSANNEKYSDTLAWMAFNPGDGWRTSEWSAGSGFPCWLQWVNNRQPVRIREYSITGSASYGGPLEWRLEGKTLEDTEWTTLDAVSRSSWPDKETRTFKIPDNNHRFQMHRLYFTRATDGNNPIACVMAWSEVRGGDA